MREREYVCVCMYVGKLLQWKQSKDKVNKICRIEVLTAVLLRICVYRNVLLC